jgi:hypothetical protein
MISMEVPRKSYLYSIEKASIEWLETIVLKSLGVRVVFEFFGKVRGYGFLMGCGFLKFVGGPQWL